MKEERSTSFRTNKLTTRSLSDHLGKLPPHALDIEESIIGGLLLESHAYESVKDFLRADHFYLQRHKEIFQAITDLKNESAPVDMRTVVNQLRKTGKLEVIGGVHVIAEITAKLSSAANIEYHARVVMEMSMKRNIIEYASRLQTLAYEDTTDIFDLMDKSSDEIKFIKDTNIVEPKEAKIKSLWKDILLEVKPPDEQPILFIDGVAVGTPGNHSLLIGKKKSRKTLFLTWLIKEFLRQPDTKADEVLFFDTEQGKSHVWQIREKVEKMTGKKIPVLYLRGKSPKERQEIIELTLSHWEKEKGVKPKLVFIDGVRDCVSNINDVDEVTEFIVWLEKLTLEHNVHICNVLHMNKADTNARGHIGTELGNKAQTTIELELDKNANCTICKCESSRDKSFDKFAFTHDKDGLPLIVGMPTQDGNTLTEDDQHRRIREVFEDGDLSYGDLKERIVNYFVVGVGKAKRMIPEWSRQGWVVKYGSGKDTKYKLITDNFAKIPTMEESHPQSDLFNEPPLNPGDEPLPF